MSFFSQPSKVIGPAALGEKNEYCVPDRLGYGVASLKDKLEPVHPLELKEKNYSTNQLKVNMTILRNTQGIHAPLRIASELKATRSIGRLHFLPSSNLSTATLLGEDDMISFTDFLNPEDFNERLVNPHIVMEKKLGLL